MTTSLMDGINEDNLVSRRQPYFVRPGRCENVVAPFRDNGGAIAYVDASSVDEYPQFLAALNRVLPLPYGGISNWDAWVDSYEEIAESWPASVMLVVEGIDALAARDLHLSMELVHYMLNTRRGLGRYGAGFTVVFCVG